MTYQWNSWTAFREADLLEAGDSNLNNGDHFVMPDAATVTLLAYDNDTSLSGDYRDQATDNGGSFDQYGMIKDDAGLSKVGGSLYVEKTFTLRGSDGKTYTLAEIEGEGHNAAGTGDDYFSFVGDVPPAGVTLTVISGQGSSGVNYSDLSATPSETVQNEAPTFDNLPDDGVIRIDENTSDVVDIESTDADGDTVTYSIVGGADAQAFEIDPQTGQLTFKDAPDYENPTDGGGNNTYDVTIRIDDGEGGTTDKTLWVKVNNVDEASHDPDCIIIEAESMQSYNFKTVQGDQASGGELVRIGNNGDTGDLSTTFTGESGNYDLTVFAQDESDGQSTIMIKVNGAVVGTITLDEDDDGSGSDDGGFSEFTLQDITLNPGDEVGLWAESADGELVRIDKIKLQQDGEVCDDKLDFAGLSRGTIVNDQFAGVTITAQRSGDDANSANDAMIFDSNNTTGGDSDLGYTGRGNILIISEDGDSSDPDDNGRGGTITFDFDNPSDLQNIVLLDIEENGGTIVLTLADGSTQTVAIPGVGDNSAQTITLNALDVVSLEINLVGSGAVDDLCWTPGVAPQTASLGGTYFMDNNDNSLEDAGDMAVANATVALLLNGVVIRTTTTDANGDYLFENLEPAAGYQVRFTDTETGKTFVDADVDGNANDIDDSDVTDNVGNTGDGTTDTITLTAGEDKRNVDAGIEDPGTASLAGRVFMDNNGNALDDSEMGVANITVQLLDENGVVIATTETLADGSYEFLGLDAGTYSVDFDENDADANGKVLVTQDVDGNANDIDDSDASQADGTTAPVTLAIGERVENIDAGIEDPGTASLAGRVFMDNNGNALDDSEMGVANITVQLLDENGVVIATTETLADGSYEFLGLDAGTYSVDFDENDADANGKVLVTQDVDGNANDIDDSDASQADGTTAPVTLAIGERVENIDAGIEDPGTASLAGRVFMDNNGNALDDSEMGVANITVQLLDENGVVIATTETLADGSYEFLGLDAGTYSVDFDENDADANGKVLVTQDVDGNANDIDDSDASQADGTTAPVTLAIGERVENIDAGIEDPGTASLGDKVFFDTNGNGRQDDGELGADGVTVFLRDGEGNVLGQTTTANGGMYLFDELDAGDYMVEFEELDGFDFTTANAAGVDDAEDSDADQTTGVTGVINLEIGEADLTVDAGLVRENTDPNAVDDEGEVCATETTTINVLANDTDVDGDTLAVAHVNGVELAVDESTTLDSGAIVTLNADGTLSYDSANAVIDGQPVSELLINTAATDSFTYSITDGQGGTSDGEVNVTLKGGFNTVETILSTLPAEGTVVFDDFTGPDAYTATLSGTGNAQLDGLSISAAYCLERSAQFVDLTDVSIDISGALDSLQSQDDFDNDNVGSTLTIDDNTITTGVAGNLDLINWIINQDFTSMDNGDGTATTYTDAEVQLAIWGITDGNSDFIGNPEGLGTQENVQEILSAALENGEGFEAGAGDLFTLVLNPVELQPDSIEFFDHDQSFIVALPFDEFKEDCIC